MFLYVGTFSTPSALPSLSSFLTHSTMSSAFLFLVALFSLCLSCLNPLLWDSSASTPRLRAASGIPTQAAFSCLVNCNTRRHFFMCFHVDFDLLLPWVAWALSLLSSLPSVILQEKLYGTEPIVCIVGNIMKQRARMPNEPQLRSSPFHCPLVVPSGEPLATWALASHSSRATIARCQTTRCF